MKKPSKRGLFYAYYLSERQIRISLEPTEVRRHLLNGWRVVRDPLQIGRIRGKNPFNAERRVRTYACVSDARRSNVECRSAELSAGC